jgi:hypothetical protein
MLNSGKKIRALRHKKNKYSNSCVIRKKNSERNKKPLCFSQSKSPLELSQFSRLWRLSRMHMGFLSKTDLKGHINWRKVRNFIII